MPALTKLVPSTKKRALHELAAPGSPEPAGAAAAEVALSEAAKEQKTANPYVTPNNRYVWMVLSGDPQHATTQADESRGPETAQAAGRGLSVAPST